MKKILSVVLVCILLLSCLSQTVFATEEKVDSIYTIDSSMEGKFISNEFSFTSMEIARVGSEYIQLSFKDGAPTATFSCEKESIYFSNCLRLVIDNQSECKQMTVEVTYDFNGHKATVENELEIDAKSGKRVYYIDLDYASYAVEIKLSFLKATTGNVMLYSLSREYVYSDSVSYIYHENSRISAVFDPETYVVSVNGTIGHSTVTKYNGAQIELHKIPTESDISYLAFDETTLVDTRPISMQFSFSVRVEGIADAYSQFILVISTQNEKRVLTTPIIAGIEPESSSYVPRKDVFKGISSSLVADAIDVNPSLAVVDVYLDRLQNVGGNGHYYSLDNKAYYFDREYINQLDKQIKAYTDTNCEVYLRFIPDSLGSGDLYKRAGADFWRDLYAYSSYLADRYNGGEHGEFSGVIVGQYADRFPVSTQDDVKAYLKFYSQLLYIVSETVGEAKIFVPISDISHCKTFDKGGLASEQFLISLSEIMGSVYQNKISFSVALCTSGVPLGIGGKGDNDGYVRFSTEAIREFERMISTASVDTTLITRDYLVNWTPPATLSGSVLTAAYTYNYLKLLFTTSAKSFVVSFDDESKLADLKYVIKYIDTSRFAEATDPALKIIGVDSWQDLIVNFNKSSIEKFELYEVETGDMESVGAKGVYDMWRFAELNSISGWYSLNGCSSISVNVSSDFGRCLVAKMHPHNEVAGEYASIIYSFDEMRDISHVDHIAYSLGIGCDSDVNAVFELKFMIGSEKEIIEGNQIIKAGELKDILIDVGEIDEISYMLISVKPISNRDAAYNLQLSKVSFISESYTSEELAEIEELQDEEAGDSDSPFSDIPITTTMVVSFSVILALILSIFFLILKKVDKNKE